MTGLYINSFVSNTIALPLNRIINRKKITIERTARKKIKLEKEKEKDKERKKEKTKGRKNENEGRKNQRREEIGTSQLVNTTFSTLFIVLTLSIGWNLIYYLSTTTSDKYFHIGFFLFIFIILEEWEIRNSYKGWKQTVALTNTFNIKII